ncbi:MAG: type II toxin-antitoxin system PemK/MazF family toxin [Bacilli bacterium]|jgi:mRNA interferase MazF
MLGNIGKKTNVNPVTVPESIKKQLSNAIDLAIGKRAVLEFANECGMVDASLLTKILDKKINALPDRRLFRKIEKASQRRVTYSHLCQICGYSEYDVDDNWMSFYPSRGSVYMIDLGFSNLDSEQNGIRPCLIIQNDLGNKNSGTISVAPLTGQIKKNYPTHVKISRREGLDIDSTICIEQTRVVSKRRMFYNGVPIKIMDLSPERIFEVNVAIEKEFGLIDVLYSSDCAFELVEQIKKLESNIKVKQSRDLVDILDGKIDDLVTYCKKYNRSIDRVIHEYEYERNENYVCAVS